MSTPVRQTPTGRTYGCAFLFTALIFSRVIRILLKPIKFVLTRRRRSDTIAITHLHLRPHTFAFHVFHLLRGICHASHAGSRQRLVEMTVLATLLFSNSLPTSIQAFSFSCRLSLTHHGHGREQYWGVLVFRLPPGGRSQACDGHGNVVTNFTKSFNKKLTKLPWGKSTPTDDAFEGIAGGVCELVARYIAGRCYPQGCYPFFARCLT